MANVREIFKNIFGDTYALKCTRSMKNHFDYIIVENTTTGGAMLQFSICAENNCIYSVKSINDMFFSIDSQIMKWYKFLQEVEGNKHE